MKIIKKQLFDKITRRLKKLYGHRADLLAERLYMLIGRYGIDPAKQGTTKRWNENDIIVITYADSVKEEDHAPLTTLKNFLHERIGDLIKVVHILPFCPSSSDDGFSVIDYNNVDPEFGTWQEIKNLGSDYDLMFDLVLNHCSAKSAWFRDFQIGVAPERHYFIEMDPETDLSQVTRPRSSPLLLKTYTAEGEKNVWTTFSADQIDLNWPNPDVLFEFLNIILVYVNNGVRILRMDAVAFLWKKIGTNCLHQPETHEVVKLLRDFLEIVAPEVIILTETNVPHKENISYFGKGDEAHMVYQFSLPPLLLHGLLSENSEMITDWASSLPKISKDCTYLNFTASHDGIGVRPLEGILTKKELDGLCDNIKTRGGLISYKSNSDGSSSPYEMNITYVSALSEKDNDKLGTDRFICSQAVTLSMKGVPAIYFHSLTGTTNHYEGVEESGINRRINRRKWDYDELTDIIDDKSTSNYKIITRYKDLLKCRKSHKAFHPNADQEILNINKSIFGFTRTSTDKSETILCLFNFSKKIQKINISDINSIAAKSKKLTELIIAKSIKDKKKVVLSPYQAAWILCD